MANQVLLSVSNNQGYAPDQITGSMTLASLLREVEQAIEMHGPDAMIVTLDSGNRYGARFGSISTYEDAFSDADPDNEGVDFAYECPNCGEGHDGMTTGTEYCRDCEEEIRSNR